MSKGDGLSRHGELEKIPYFIGPNWAVEAEAGLSPIERVVLLNLFRRAGKDDRTSFPSTSRIATDIGSSKPSVIKAIKSLIKKGCIEKEERHGEDGKQMSNLYKVNLDWKPQHVVDERPKSQRGRYPRGKETLPQQETLPSPVKRLDPPSKETLPEVLPSISTTNTLSTTTTSAQSPSKAPVSIPEEFIGLPLFLEGGNCYHDKWTPKLFEELDKFKEAWKRNCPLIDIKTEISKAHTWCMSTGKIRKKMSVFLNTWMTNAQRYAERGQNAGQQTFTGANRKNPRVLNVSQGWLQNVLGEDNKD
jgi:hypothetical protein